MKTTMWLTVAIACATLWGCDQGAASGSSTATAQATGSAQAAAELGGGTKHEPPIKVDEVKAGDWYCDMGTVHYTRHEEGDGKCSLCGMKLKHKE